MKDNFKEEYTILMKDFQLRGALNENITVGISPMKDNLMGGATDVNNGGRNLIKGAHQSLPDSFEDDEAIPAGGGPSGPEMGTGIKDEGDIETLIIQIRAPHRSGRLLKRFIKVLKNEVNQAQFTLLIATYYTFISVIGGILIIHTLNIYIEAIKTPFIR